MFRNNMVVSLKSGENFFAENHDEIRIPFGTEYSLYMKNQNDTDALVSITIDGKDVLSGNKIILRSKSILDLEGFLDSGSVRNKFKFIERTKEIESHLGVKPDDGIVSITFDYEKRKPNYQPCVVYYPQWIYTPYTITTTNLGSTPMPSPLWGKTISGGGSWYTTDYTNQVYSTYTSQNINENGITVRGDDAFQSFGYGWLGEMENSPTTISFRLLGFNDGESKVYTKDRVRCSSCGRTSKISNKFCPNCGTKLQIK